MGGSMGDERKRLTTARFGRRDFLRYAGVAAGAGVLAACKKAETAGGTTTGPGATSATGATGSGRPTIEQEPGSLSVSDWSGYGNGDYYPDKERRYLWENYVTATGDTPQFTLFENDDAGFTKVVTGARYDVIHPCAYRFQDYVDLGVMQPWDTSLIANWSNLNPTLEAFGQIDGQQYFIVEDWGFIAPLYRNDKVEPKEDSFSLLWDDRYEKRISWIDTLEMLVIAGFYHQVPDPWTMTDDELAQMRDFLISKKHLVSFFWGQSYDLWLAFQRGDIWIGYSWPDTVGYAVAEGMDVTYMQPKEGRISWSCGLGLFADSQNYYHAHEYANSWSDVKAAGFLEGWYYYGHANTTVDLSTLPPAIVDAFSLDDLSILEEPNSNPESWISRRDVYSQYWSEVKAG
jgi:spermidine/putrescine transport system substrate-binding protein